MTTMRLNKRLAHAGVASRRAAEELIRAGRVTVDGDVVEDVGRVVAEDAVITVDGRTVAGAEVRVVHLLNKPLGVVSTASDEKGRRNVVDLVGGDERLYPVGRLDIDTSGLVLLTNDGDLAYKLLHPSFEVPRTYRAKVQGAVADRALRTLREGVLLEDGMTAPARVRRHGTDVLELTIHEGKKRQVRRMCEAVGHPVIHLMRTRFGPIGLGDLPRGAHRPLRREEVAALRNAAEGRR